MQLSEFLLDLTLELGYCGPGCVLIALRLATREIFLDSSSFMMALMRKSGPYFSLSSLMEYLL
jgi:hypothetical protein